MHIWSHCLRQEKYLFRKRNKGWMTKKVLPFQETLIQKFSLLKTLRVITPSDEKNTSSTEE